MTATKTEDETLFLHQPNKSRFLHSVDWMWCMEAKVNSGSGQSQKVPASKRDTPLKASSEDNQKESRPSTLPAITQGTGAAATTTMTSSP